MVKTYADWEFYKTEYRAETDPAISVSDFSYYAMLATTKIRFRTNGNIKESEEIPEEVRMCCCEIAERLYELDKAKGENGLILQSYSNDGDSGTFKTDDVTTKAVETAVDKIIRNWLAGTGLLFCGVGR